MAERRMFAKSIVCSARFLRMPATSRLLYYDLGMAADDDGVVEAFTVMRTTGATEDDLRVLATKEFIRVLNEDLVSVITGWNINNQLRKDRYHPSIYAKLLVELGDGNQAATSWQPDGNHVEPEVSIGKGSKGKGSKDVPPTADSPTPRRNRFVPPTVEEVAEYVRSRGSRVDPQGFVDFYTAKGWLVGKTPMKDWKAACRNAESWDRWKQIESPSPPAPRGRYETVIVDGEAVDIPC